MARNPKTALEPVTISAETFMHIKQALMVIDQLDELQCWGLTPSTGYLHIAADLARDLLKRIETVKV